MDSEQSVSHLLFYEADTQATFNLIHSRPVLLSHEEMIEFFHIDCLNRFSKGQIFSIAS